ncbi:hypothetical protein BG006_006461 [Podila minutissima]|uniref:Uncharacterized protein n=1 Tax=Podila minutissima TaxID=64525 RepID=A0A9P5SN04_9FUNG|nr:hypothetical protein BG006_006461 [Podila minutissima]
MVRYWCLGSGTTSELYIKNVVRSGKGQTSGNWEDALSTVSVAMIEMHTKDFHKYCPDNVYVSMTVAYPTKWTFKLPALPDATLDTGGMQQVAINVSNNNFGEIIPKEHVEFMDRLKNVGKRSAEDDGDDADDHTK